MNKYLKLLAVGTFIAGLFFGSLSPVSATPQFSFAGYHANVSNRGVRANIDYINPNVPTGQSLEWVMADDGGYGKWAQIGWIKRYNDPAPIYFGEIGCGANVCRRTAEQVPYNTTHLYQVNLNSTNEYWVWRIDGEVRGTSPVGDVGLTQTARASYEGETTDTMAQLGGTFNSPLRIWVTSYSTAPGVWYQVNPVNFMRTTTSGTCYRATSGFTGGSGGYSFVDNWTVTPPQC